MLMAIATAHDVARRAHRIVAVGSTAQLNVLSGRIDWLIDAFLWRSQRRSMWRIVLAGSWPWGARSTAQLNVLSGCIDGVIDACFGDNGARCGASCSQDRGRGAHDRQPNSTCRVGASMDSLMHAMAITAAHDVGRRAHRIVAVGSRFDSPTQRVEWAH